MIHAAVVLFYATTIALTQFWAMHYMINNHQQGLNKTSSLRMPEFIHIKRNTILHSKDRAVPKKPKPKKRPVQPKLKLYSAQIKPTEMLNMDMPNLDIPIQTSRFGDSVLTGLQIDKGEINADIIPLVRIEPIYPVRAANRRIEGWASVALTVTKEGTVKDAVIVASQPNSIFDRAALKAIKRWKFKPHIIAGKAYERRAVQTFTFNLPR